MLDRVDALRPGAGVFVSDELTKNKLESDGLHHGTCVSAEAVPTASTMYGLAGTPGLRGTPDSYGQGTLSNSAAPPYTSTGVAEANLPDSNAPNLNPLLVGSVSASTDSYMDPSLGSLMYMNDQPLDSSLLVGGGSAGGGGAGVAMSPGAGGAGDFEGSGLAGYETGMLEGLPGTMLDFDAWTSVRPSALLVSLS